MPLRTNLETRGFEAACFDLFDTLILFDTDRYRSRHQKIADIAGVDRELFNTAWLRTRNPAVAGLFASHLDRVTAVLDQLGVTDKAAIDAACAAERAAVREAVTVVPGIAELLAELVRRGLLLAIISNATAAGRLILEETGLKDFFTELIFSYDVKLRKPDPAVYTLACDRLKVSPRYTAYIADGYRNEHAGALKAGLTPIRFDPSGIHRDQPVPPGTLDCRTPDDLRRILLH